ncbi:AAA family ATPase [Clostridium estertheticum]|uniref:AAA family ATPase n=1 Tax=Clostridium estertheticum TaxID=238834 RepID=A0A7Y3WUM0_9CLOT|nr:AAA family ATPase [Clostridium estertheticum]NNU78150.1 AAA family ATPase [Clostridium estertheticum]WBL47737.1 ATP-binding protein [Clostridium estertheticum]
MKTIELIYVWIEKFRNIEQCGFSLSKDFSVIVNHDSIETKNNVDISIKTISIKEKIKRINIYGDNICNVTAVVGKNSVGKSNFLTCIGDLITSFQDSSFMLVYFDNINNNYILECNQIAIKNNNSIRYSIQENYQPKTTIYNFNNGKIDEYFTYTALMYNIEFITVKESLNYMMYPNANCFHSFIGRFGLSYENCGLLYQFIYLKDYNNHTENFKNNDIKINFEIKDVIRGKRTYKLNILPEYFPGKECLFDVNERDGKNIYKKVFMLRFFEKVLNNFRLTNEGIIKNKVDELMNVVSVCEGNIDKLVGKYNEIKRKIIQIRTILMEKHMESDININMCYNDFVEQLEKTIAKINECDFESSFKCGINVSSILGQKQFMNDIEKLLELADEHDVWFEFVPCNIKISIDNLSDGMKYLLYLYSTIHKCFKQNPLHNFKTVVLILDEPDVHMHPEWSRNLLNNMFNFLKQEFCNTNFQIILSTHSPFILSDIMKESIIYLQKDKNGKIIAQNYDLNTFGLNIHTLFKDSFFMDSTIGEFAKNKLNEVIEFLINDEYVGNMNKEKAKYIIDNIGENLIRNKLLKMYDDKYIDSLEDMSEKILHYQNKVIQLQKIISNGVIVDKSKLSNLKSELENTLISVQDLIKCNGDKND